MPANPLEYNKKGPHSFEWGLLVRVVIQNFLKNAAISTVFKADE